MAAAAGLLTTAGLLAGCAGDPDAPTASGSADAASSPPSSEATQATQTPTASPEPAGPTATDLSARDLPGFTAADGRIACLFTDDSGAPSVRCDVLDNSWATPDPPADCAFDWGSAVGLTADGTPGRLLCISDTVVGIRGQTDGRRELSPDTLATFRGIGCLVQPDGVSCYDLATHEHSFFVSPLTYEVV